jgi:hypothetical protein
MGGSTARPVTKHAGDLYAAIGSGVQAGDRFRSGSEGGIAGCRVPALASLDELDLVRIQAAHGRRGQLTAWRAGRVRLGYRFGGRIQRGVLGEHVRQRGGAVRGRDVGGEDLPRPSRR